MSTVQSCSNDRGVKIKVGSFVEFKYDVEQCGKVLEITKMQFGGFKLLVENKDGFPGEYARYATRISIDADQVFDV